jgi:hypothetical protein
MSSVQAQLLPVKSQLLSIVLVSWNVRDHVVACIESIVAHAGLAFEIVVVDNASGDGTREACARFGATVDFVALDENLGFARAVNIGLCRCSGDYVLLLNPDTVIFEGGLAAMRDFLEAHPEAGIAGPRLVDARGRMQFSARKFPSLRTPFFGRSSLAWKIARTNRLSMQEAPGFGQASRGALEVDWVVGACLMFKRAVAESIGLLDERFFLYWEDADWCLRAREQGWRTFWVREAEIMHAGQASSQKTPLRSVVLFHVSVFKYFQKNLNRQKSRALAFLVMWPIALRCVFVLLRTVLWRRQEKERKTGKKKKGKIKR